MTNIIAARMAYDFPLRPNFRAQVVLPRDMTTDEARRLVTFIKTLVIPERT